MASTKPTALSLVLDLTSRLAADYATLPLEVITSCVQAAAGAVELFGEDVVDQIATVETLARAELSAVRTELAPATGARVPALAG